MLQHRVRLPGAAFGAGVRGARAGAFAGPGRRVGELGGVGAGVGEVGPAGGGGRGRVGEDLDVRHCGGFVSCGLWSWLGDEVGGMWWPQAGWIGCKRCLPPPILEGFLFAVIYVGMMIQHAVYLLHSLLGCFTLLRLP